MADLIADWKVAMEAETVARDARDGTQEKEDAWVATVMVRQAADMAIEGTSVI